MNSHFRIVCYQKAHQSPPKWDSPLKSLKEPIKMKANRQEAQKHTWCADHHTQA